VLGVDHELYRADRGHERRVEPVLARQRSQRRLAGPVLGCSDRSGGFHGELIATRVRRFVTVRSGDN